MNRLKPKEEKRNIRMALSVSKTELDLIESIAKFYGTPKVHVLMNGLKMVQKKYDQDKAKQNDCFINESAEE